MYFLDQSSQNTQNDNFRLHKIQSRIFYLPYFFAFSSGQHQQLGTRDVWLSNSVFFFSEFFQIIREKASRLLFKQHFLSRSCDSF